MHKLLGILFFLLFPACVMAQVPMRIVVPNASSTGTTLNKLVKLTGAPSTAVIAGTSDNNGILGIVVAGAGTTGSAVIQTFGMASCVFDGATTADDYFQYSPTTAGDCHDSGAATYPASNQVLGYVLSTHGGAGTYTVYLFGPGIVSGGGVTGSASSTQCTFWNGSTSITGSSNCVYAAGSGFTLKQGANSTDAFTIFRFTDTSPSGNFFNLQNNALNSLITIGWDGTTSHGKISFLSNGGQSLPIWNTGIDLEFLGNLTGFGSEPQEFHYMGMYTNVDTASDFDGHGIDLSAGMVHQLTSTGDISPTISNGRAGELYGFRACQDGTGGRKWTWPSSMSGMSAVPAALNACSFQWVINTTTTQGYAVAPATPIQVNLTAQTSSTGATNLSVIGNAGEYRVCGAIQVTTAGTTGTMSASVTYNDINGNSQTDIVVPTVAGGTGNIGAHGSGCIMFWATTGAAIQYLTTATSISGSQFAIQFRLETM